MTLAFTVFEFMLLKTPYYFYNYFYNLRDLLYVRNSCMYVKQLEER